MGGGGGLKQGTPGQVAGNWRRAQHYLLGSVQHYILYTNNISSLSYTV